MAGDAALMVTGGYGRQLRLARHIWRMCAALFIAVGSLFLGQPQVFPASLQGTFWLGVPSLCVVLAMLYWLGHTLVKELARRRQARVQAMAPVA